MSANLIVSGMAFGELPGDPNGKYVQTLSWNGFPYWLLNRGPNTQQFYIIGEYGKKKLITTTDAVIIPVSSMVQYNSYKIQFIGTTTNFIEMGAGDAVINQTFVYNGTAPEPFGSTGTVETIASTSFTETDEMIWSFGYDIENTSVFLAHTSCDYPADDSVWFIDSALIQSISVKTDSKQKQDDFKTLIVSGLSTRNDDVEFVEDPNGTYVRAQGFLNGRPYWQKSIQGLDKNEIIYTVSGIWDLNTGSGVTQSSGALTWSLARSEKTTLVRSLSSSIIRERANVLINFERTPIAKKNGAFPWDAIKWNTPTNAVSLLVVKLEKPPLFSRQMFVLLGVFLLLFGGALVYATMLK